MTWWQGSSAIRRVTEPLRDLQVRPDLQEGTEHPAPRFDVAVIESKVWNQRICTSTNPRVRLQVRTGFGPVQQRRCVVCCLAFATSKYMHVQAQQLQPLVLRNSTLAVENSKNLHMKLRAAQLLPESLSAQYRLTKSHCSPAAICGISAH